MKRGSGLHAANQRRGRGVQREEKPHMGGETRKKNSKPNSGLKTKWIKYSEYVGGW